MYALLTERSRIEALRRAATATHCDCEETAEGVFLLGELS